MQLRANYAKQITQQTNTLRYTMHLKLDYKSMLQPASNFEEKDDQNEDLFV